MKSLLVFVALFVPSLQFPLNGTLEGPDELIFNGAPAPNGAYPFFVSLQVQGYYHTCGGALISNQYILTAAHCVWSPQDNYYYAQQAEQAFVERVSIRLGTNLPNGGQLIRVRAAKVHPQYNRQSLMNDVAIVALAQPVRFSNLIRPIRLSASHTGPGSARVIGFGYMAYDPESKQGRSPPNLQHLQVSIDSDRTCNSQLFPSYMKATTICVMGNRAGVLPGDSGSPMVQQRGNQWVQIGIASFADHYGYLKNRNGQIFAPAGYVRVSSYCTFIAQLTGNAVQCQ
ncbi:hypothetical protein QR680_011991 [Steinernema hermaphroditum]|uniref:Peptidase S1 domain-containing protein n=1 Tax=Steinernema hermaphroditum TaxID=289476 RepID=A0AA39I0G7_9BILA|nr:hypothetical protein QR680_011991 [Steinernema hermaphroditum]